MLPLERGKKCIQPTVFATEPHYTLLFSKVSATQYLRRYSFGG